MRDSEMSQTTGIEVRHSRRCLSRRGAKCSCRPTYQASVWSARDKRRIRKTFPTLAEARVWRAEATVGLRRGSIRASSAGTLREAADAWIVGAQEGRIRTRSGDRYKPSALRGYEAALRNRVLPDLGGARLSDIRRADIQDFVDRLLAEGLDASTIRNTVMPLRAVFRRAVARGDVAVNPTAGLELPAVRGKPDRIVSPVRAAELLAALPDADRALWATALYGGLRRGELMALSWRNVDLAAGIIRVERSWDAKNRVIVSPKSRAGYRKVPIAAALRGFLIEHKLQSGRSGGFVFGRISDDLPFDASAVAARAYATWREAGLEPITLHEARHTFASLMIAAGVNAKALAAYMGHASVTITYDRYGHLMPGNEHEAAELLDAYLARAIAAPAIEIG
jgi:integrase